MTDPKRSPQKASCSGIFTLPATASFAKALSTVGESEVDVDSADERVIAAGRAVRDHEGRRAEAELRMHDAFDVLGRAAAKLGGHVLPVQDATVISSNLENSESGSRSSDSSARSS